MVVFVKVEFIGKPPYEERQGMIQAAKHLTKDPKTVDVAVDDEKENMLIAVFRMKNEAMYKAIEKIWPLFAKITRSRNDMTVSFEQEKAYDLRKGNKYKKSNCL
ncbi:MAG: hypothetical protein R6U55_10625 [Desulfovermiculus sp.]